MSNQLPKNAKIMRELLTQYLEGTKPHMESQSDKAWVQAEIDRYRGQLNSLTHGVEQKTVKKSTGIVRRVDDLGRMVIPKELRKVFNIENGDPMEIFMDNTTIVLQKYEPACHFCNRNTEEITMFRGRRICESCLNELFNQM